MRLKEKMLFRWRTLVDLRYSVMHLLISKFRLLSAFVYLVTNKIPDKTQKNFIFPKQLKNFSDLRIALIVDDFSKNSFEREVETLNLVYGGSLEQLESFEPDLLFVESVAEGEKKSWKGKLFRRDKELSKLVLWCNKNQIPTIFWNKEDPVHFESFLRVSSMFDFVFTTDSNMENRYRKYLKSRISTLTFGVSTKIFNPFDSGTRNKGALFAGSFVSRYLHRTIDMFEVFSGVSQIYPVKVVDRHLRPGQKSKFVRFDSLSQIAPSLDYEGVIRAHKEFLISININTVKFSPTMFSRRALEATLSNCIVVSNRSQAQISEFGSEHLILDSGSEIAKGLRELSVDPVELQGRRIRGVAKVLSQHTVKGRLVRVINTVFKNAIESQLSLQNTPKLVFTLEWVNAKEIGVSSEFLIDKKGNFSPQHLILYGESDITFLENFDELLDLVSLIGIHYEDLGELVLNIVLVNNQQGQLKVLYEGRQRGSLRTVSFF